MPLDTFAACNENSKLDCRGINLIASNVLKCWLVEITKTNVQSNFVKIWKIIQQFTKQNTGFQCNESNQRFDFESNYNSADYSIQPPDRS